MTSLIMSYSTIYDSSSAVLAALGRNATTASSLASTVTKSSFTFTVSAWTPVNAILLTIGLVGFAANSFASFVICRYKPILARMPNYFVLNQCFLDLTAGFLLCVTTGFSYYQPSTVTQFIVYCAFMKFRLAFNGIFLASIWNLVALTAERCVKVVHPIKHKLNLTRTKVIIACAAAWCVGLLATLIVAFTAKDFVTGTCNTETPANSPSGKTSAIISVFQALVLPVVIVGICYTRMALKVRQMAVAPTAQASASNAAKPHMNRVKRRILKLLTIVLIVMFVSVAPKQILSVLSAAGIQNIDANGLLMSVCIALNYSNCCVNPFIYLLKHEEFQKGVKALLGVKPNAGTSTTGPVTAESTNQKSPVVRVGVREVNVVDNQ